jgi:hypothetical protein
MDSLKNLIRKIRFSLRGNKNNTILKNCTEIFFNSEKEVLIITDNHFDAIKTCCKNIPIDDLIIDKNEIYVDDYEIDLQSIDLCKFCKEKLTF